MKTLKFLVLLCIVACFSVGTANAQQTERWVGSYSWPVVSSWYNCIDEPLSGTMENIITVSWKEGENWQKVQQRFTGIFTGDVTGDTYTLSQIENQHQFNNWNYQVGNWYYLTTIIIKKDGKPVSLLHYLIHGTCNNATWDKKEDNWDVWMELVKSECF